MVRYPDIDLVIGEVLYVNPILRICEVLLVGRDGCVTASYGSISSSTIDGLQIDIGISIGDRVVVMLPSGDDDFSGSALTCNVVLCKAGINSVSFPDLLSDSGKYTDNMKMLSEHVVDSDNFKLYDTIRHYLTGKFTDIYFPPSARLDDTLSGDMIISKGLSSVRLNERLIDFQTSHSRLALTDTGTLLTDCLFNKSRTAAGWSTTAAVGPGRQIEGFDKLSESCTDEITGVLKQTGVLSGGETHTIIKQNIPIAQWSMGSDGGFCYKSSTGLCSVLGSDINVRTVGGSCGILPTADSTAVKLLADIPDSDRRSLIDEDKDLSQFVEKFDRAAVVSDLDPLPDPVSVNKESKISSIVDQAPDGSIVLRDAWGSEIRMFGGDIFISPARNLIKVIPGDSIEAVEGVISNSGASGINIGSALGSVDVYGKESVSLGTGGAVNIVSEGTAMSLNTDGISMSSSRNINAQISGSINVAVDRGINVSSNDLTVLGKNSVSVGTSTTIVNQSAGLIELGARSVTLNSDVVIAEDQSEGFTLEGSKCYPAHGSGTLSCTGYTTIAKGLSVNSWVKSCGQLSCSSVTVDNFNKEAVGVFKGKKPAETKLNKPPKLKAKTNSEATAPSAAKVNPKELLLGLFKNVSKAVFSILPKRKSKTKITSTCIEGSGKKVYIYPGEAFWTSAGKYTINTESLDRANYSIAYDKSGLSN